MCVAAAPLTDVRLGRVERRPTAPSTSTALAVSAEQRELLGEERGIANQRRADLQALRPGIHQPVAAQPGALQVGHADRVFWAVAGSDRRVQTHFSKL